MEFRNLHANEIECRVSQINQYGATLLLYKDARCDMRILDETVEPQNWQREHREINGVIYCGVSIKCVTNDKTSEWVTKWDAGAESYTEKEKGQASDSFKRACFNWGLGRELYTAPNVRVKPKKKDDGKPDIFEQGGKYKTWTKFSVADIEYTDNAISYLEVIDQDGTVRYRYGEVKPITKDQHKKILNANLGDDRLDKWLKYFKVDDIESMSYRNAEFMLSKVGVAV